MALIAYDKEHGNLARARQVGERSLEKCKNDLTDIFIFLLEDARKSGDKVRYKKFYSSAKRRRAVDIARVDKVLEVRDR